MQFPVLRLIKKRGEMVFETGNVAQTYEQLTSCGAVHIQTHSYDDALVIDSTGASVRIIKAINPRGRGIFFGYSLLRVRRMQVDLVLAPSTSQFPLSDLKKLVVHSVKRDKFFWNEAFEIRDVIREIEQAETHAVLINLLVSTFCS